MTGTYAGVDRADDLGLAAGKVQVKHRRLEYELEETARGDGQAGKAEFGEAIVDEALGVEGRAGPKLAWGQTKHRGNEQLHTGSPANIHILESAHETCDT